MPLTRVQVLLPEDDLRRLRHLARIQGRSVSSLIREMVAESLSRQSREHRERRRLLTQRLRRHAARLATQFPNLPVHTPDDLKKMREERLHGFGLGA